MTKQNQPTKSGQLSPKEVLSRGQEVLSRGVAEVLPDAKTLLNKMSNQKLRVYLGIDPTGSVLTLGHSVVLRKLQQFADMGHEAILLIGNGTVRIGDPTGRDASRPELTDEEIEANFADWKSQAERVLDFDKITIKRNADWLDKLSYQDLVKIMAKATVSQLMERDMFQDRIKAQQPIHAHEIIYPLLQGYDSVAMDVDLEIGGTDQTFNMMMGRSLQKAYRQKEKWVLTTPLLEGTDGRKMGKSYQNYIALTENPIDMYGKVMSIKDELMLDYFRLLTNLPTKELENIEKSLVNNENPMVFKKKLAFVITKQYHNTQQAQKAQDHFEKTIQSNQLPDFLPTINPSAPEITVLELASLGLPQESKSNLRRLIAQKAVELLEPGQKPGMGQKPTAPSKQVVIKPDMVVRVGKRCYFRLGASEVGSSKSE